jgi:hypothetical protein
MFPRRRRDQRQIVLSEGFAGPLLLELGRKRPARCDNAGEPPRNMIITTVWSQPNAGNSEIHSQDCFAYR